MDGPFVGSEALTTGALTSHALRTRHRPVHPNVYLSRDVTYERDIPRLERLIQFGWMIIRVTAADYADSVLARLAAWICERETSAGKP